MSPPSYCILRPVRVLSSSSLISYTPATVSRSSFTPSHATPTSEHLQSSCEHYSPSLSQLIIYVPPYASPPAPFLILPISLRRVAPSSTSSPAPARVLFSRPTRLAKSSVAPRYSVLVDENQYKQMKSELSASKRVS